MASPFDPFGPGSQPGNPGGSSVGPSPRLTSSIDSSADPLTIAKPPVALLAVAAIVAALGIIIAALGFASWMAIIGWAFAGPVAIGILAVFIAQDTARRAEPVYLRPDWLGSVYAAVMVLSAVGIIVGALGFAFWIGRH